MRVDVRARLAAMLDAGSATPLALPELERQSSVLGCSGQIAGTQVVLGAIDPQVARGAIGTLEASALSALFVAARSRSAPLVLLLCSAGARLDQGLAALGAFRRLFATALEVKRAGTPILAVVGEVCYGGASMLACLGERRIFTAGSRLGMSGPRIVEALAGKAELDARDPNAVAALFGGAQRARLNANDRVVSDDAGAVRDAVREWLVTRTAASMPGFDAEHRILRERLQHAGIELPRSPRAATARLRSRMSAVFADGFETLIGAGVVRGVRMMAGREVTITGIVDAHRLDAVAAWMIAESIVTSVRTRPERPIVLLYDSIGHAMTRADEAVLLSAYLVHLAESILWAREQGVAVSTWIIGEASGGAYVALTAQAQRVIAFPGVSVRVLPQIAIEQVLNAVSPADPERAAWSRLGLIDDALDTELVPAAVAKAAGLPSA